jgi:hypothetical protein
MKIETEFNCEGYYGFGIGVMMYRYIPGEPYCNICGRKEPCWKKHKERVADLVPAIVNEFEKMARETQGPELMKRWYEKYKIADPYCTVMTGNIEDGGSVVLKGKPRDRGFMTMEYPFDKVDC